MFLAWKGYIHIDDPSITTDNYATYFDVDASLTPSIFRALISPLNPPQTRGVPADFLNSKYREALYSYEVSGYLPLGVKLPHYQENIVFCVNGVPVQLKELYKQFDVDRAKEIKAWIFKGILEEGKSSDVREIPDSFRRTQILTALRRMHRAAVVA